MAKSASAHTATSGPRPVRAPRGTTLTCKYWLIEAAYRMPSSTRVRTFATTVSDTSPCAK